ncbi:hypothetical protein KOI35_06715 [Actinoplanes bogorensis]|uniref:Ameloblastin n=1 Tax=Paractinoplanes bogorensis TaxID=1610840 RepID=A0ABS5YKI1_9ACTN|nr:hypothetical protein [Actinoplanes bogorensis]MBU2663198.1 hypothetical protein [Actinoplanes bogorensis]
MRKFWYAGAAIAGGLFLFAAAPAQADLLPGADTAAQQADERLADLLGQSNGVNVDNPLQYSSLNDSPLARVPVAQLKPGQNSTNLRGALPQVNKAEAAGEERPQILPDADVVRGSTRTLPVRSLPIFGSNGLPLLTGMMPNGQVGDFNFDDLPGSGRSTSDQPAADQSTESFDGGIPLLGGLGGLLPANRQPRTLPATDKPDVSGMPGGGVAIMPAATDGSPVPTTTTPAPTAAPDDPRLHEEPIDPDTTTEHRPFTNDGRPVAGVDQQYK